MQSGLDLAMNRWADDHRPALRYLERIWSPAALLDEAGRLAGGLAAAGLRPGERVGLALPNLPATAVALLACWRGGFVAAPADPRQGVAALLDWQARLRPAALVTLDLATVFERSRPLLQDPGLRLVAIARIADQLSPLKRLLTPWLRAGGTVRGGDDPRVRPWTALLGTPPSGPWRPALLLPDGTALDFAGLTPPEPGPSLLARPLSEPAALAALLGALAGDGPLLLSPRLDARTLDKIAKATGISRRSS